MTMENDLVERPIHSLTLDSKQPAWEQILGMFARYRAAEPPWRLRDELVCILSWARYGSAAAVRIQALEAELARKTEALNWTTISLEAAIYEYSRLDILPGAVKIMKGHLRAARSSLEEKTDV